MKNLLAVLVAVLFLPFAVNATETAAEKEEMMKKEHHKEHHEHKEHEAKEEDKK